MSADANAPTASEYIVHHLTHWQNKPQTEIVDFTVFNIDSLFFSTLLGVLVCFFLWKAARRATSGVPGRFQAAVEILVEMVESEAKGIVHNAKSRKLVAPLALMSGRDEDASVAGGAEDSPTENQLALSFGWRYFAPCVPVTCAAAPILKSCLSITNSKAKGCKAPSAADAT